MLWNELDDTNLLLDKACLKRTDIWNVKEEFRNLTCIHTSFQLPFYVMLPFLVCYVLISTVCSKQYVFGLIPPSMKHDFFDTVRNHDTMCTGTHTVERQGQNKIEICRNGNLNHTGTQISVSGNGRISK